LRKTFEESKHGRKKMKKSFINILFIVIYLIKKEFSKKKVEEPKL